MVRITGRTALLLILPFLAGCLAGKPAPTDPPLPPALENAGEENPEEGDLPDDLLLELEEEMETVHIADPIEPLNRGIFWVNDKLYFYLFKPVARALRVIPEPARKSVGKAFDNIGAPVRVANCVLQAKMECATTELGRFVLNSTVGLCGLFDPARGEGLEPHDEDFGQTLGVYGLGQGFYLVLPVLGPSSLRDGIGKGVDGFGDPLRYLLGTGEAIGAKVAERENWLSLDKDSYESIKKEALDPYLTIRNGYVQRREGQVGK